MLTNEFITTSHPTQQDLDRAEAENKIVLYFLRAPEPFPANIGEEQQFTEGLLTGLSLKRNCRLIVICVPLNIDIEEAIEGYKDAIRKNTYDKAGVTSLAGFNLYRDYEGERVKNKGW